MAGCSKLVDLLVVCALLEVVRGQGRIGFERPCGVDNFSCPRIGNLSEIPLRCFRRQELCNGLPFCEGGTDEGLNIVSLECIPGRPEDSVFRCEPDNPVPMSALCNGVNDCGLGNDETTALCENKCLLPYYGGCPYTRNCITSEFDVNCGDCLTGFTPNPANTSTAADCDDINECAFRYYWYRWYRWRRYTICGPRGRCINTDGSFTCLCVHGYIWNGHRCIRRSVGRRYYWIHLLYRVYLWRYHHHHI